MVRQSIIIDRISLIEYHQLFLLVYIGYIDYQEHVKHSLVIICFLIYFIILRNLLKLVMSKKKQIKRDGNN